MLGRHGPHHPPFGHRLDDEGDVLVGLHIRRDDPHQPAHFRPRPGVFRLHAAIVMQRADIVDDRARLGHLAPVGQQQDGNPALRVEGFELGRAQGLGHRVAVGQGIDRDAARVGGEAHFHLLD